MRSILSEKGLVVILFVLVLVTFAFAQEDSKKIEAAYSNDIQTINFSSNTSSTSQQPDADLLKGKNPQTDLLK